MLERSATIGYVESYSECTITELTLASLGLAGLASVGPRVYRCPARAGSAGSYLYLASERWVPVFYISAVILIME